MDYAVKLEDGSEIVLLYAKNFQWKHQKDLFEDNEPISGRVYRALKTPNDSNYYLNLRASSNQNSSVKIEGLRLQSLKYDTPEWACEFIEINDKNIISLSITDEDYANIYNWLDNGQKDLIDQLYSRGMDVTASEVDEVANGDKEGGFNITENDLKDQIMDILGKVNEAKELQRSLNSIGVRDPMSYKAILGFLKAYTGVMDLEDNSPILPLYRDIATSEELGRVANITAIARNIEKLISEKKDNKELIYDIMVIAIFELIRQDINK